MVDLKKIQTLEQITPKPTVKIRRPEAAEGGPSFQDTLEGVTGSPLPAEIAAKPTGLSKAGEGVKFSNHAVERMQSRGIFYSQDDITKINDAISRAAAKGSKDSLLLMDDSALIVSVKNKTVVTVMDKNALKENVFTNIDSTVVL